MYSTRRSCIHSRQGRVLHLGTELRSKPEPNVESLSSSSTNSRVVSAFPGCPPRAPLPCWMRRFERQQTSERSQRHRRVRGTFDHFATGQCRCCRWASGEFLGSSNGHGPVQLPVAEKRNSNHRRDFFYIYDSPDDGGRQSRAVHSSD
jgi:hypothetical protein